jgi:hypothetical protein
MGFIHYWTEHNIFQKDKVKRAVRDLHECWLVLLERNSVGDLFDNENNRLI